MELFKEAPCELPTWSDLSSRTQQADRPQLVATWHPLLRSGCVVPTSTRNSKCPADTVGLLLTCFTPKKRDCPQNPSNLETLRPRICEQRINGGAGRGRQPSPTSKPQNHLLPPPSLGFAKAMPLPSGPLVGVELLLGVEPPPGTLNQTNPITTSPGCLPPSVFGDAGASPPRATATACRATSNF